MIEEDARVQQREYYVPVLPLFRSHGERCVHRLDSHQSAYGSYVIAHHVAHVFGYAGLEDLSFGGQVFRSGDLSLRFFGVPLYEHAEEPNISGHSTLSAAPRQIEQFLPPTGGHVGSRYVWHNPNAPIKRRAVVFGNSCFERGGRWRLSWWFARLFEDFHFVWDIDVHDDYAAHVGADVVIGQTMERFMFTRMPTM
jgi:hypothetical protein